MATIFRALNEYLGLNDGFHTTDLVGTVPADAKAIRLTSNATISQIRLLNLKPNSACILTLNGREHTRFLSDDKGEAATTFSQNVDLSRIHRAQLRFEGANTMPVLYAIA